MEKGFLQSLFDFSFSSFITTKLIKIIYAICMVLIALAGLGMIISGFSQSIGTGLLMIILTPVVALLYLMAARIWLEMTIVVFRISQNVQIIADAKKGTPPAPAAGGPVA